MSSRPVNRAPSAGRQRAVISGKIQPHVSSTPSHNGVQQTSHSYRRAPSSTATGDRFSRTSSAMSLSGRGGAGGYVTPLTISGNTGGRILGHHTRREEVSEGVGVGDLFVVAGEGGRGPESERVGIGSRSSSSYRNRSGSRGRSPSASNVTIATSRQSSRQHANAFSPPMSAAQHNHLGSGGGLLTSKEFLRYIDTITLGGCGEGEPSDHVNNHAVGGVASATTVGGKSSKCIYLRYTRGLGPAVGPNHGVTVATCMKAIPEPISSAAVGCLYGPTASSSDKTTIASANPLRGVPGSAAPVPSFHVPATTMTPSHSKQIPLSLTIDKTNLILTPQIATTASPSPLVQHESGAPYGHSSSPSRTDTTLSPITSSERANECASDTAFSYVAPIILELKAIDRVRLFAPAEIEIEAKGIVGGVYGTEMRRPTSNTSISSASSSSASTCLVNLVFSDDAVLDLCYRLIMAKTKGIVPPRGAARAASGERRQSVANNNVLATAEMLAGNPTPTATIVPSTHISTDYSAIIPNQPLLSATTQMIHHTITAGCPAEFPAKYTDPTIRTPDYVVHERHVNLGPHRPYVNVTLRSVSPSSAAAAPPSVLGVAVDARGDVIVTTAESTLALDREKRRDGPPDSTRKAPSGVTRVQMHKEPARYDSDSTAHSRFSASPQPNYRMPASNAYANGNGSGGAAETGVVKSAAGEDQREASSTLLIDGEAEGSVVRQTWGSGVSVSPAAVAPNGSRADDGLTTPRPDPQGPATGYSRLADADSINVQAATSSIGMGVMYPPASVVVPGVARRAASSHTRPSASSSLLGHRNGVASPRPFSTRYSHVHPRNNRYDEGMGIGIGGGGAHRGSSPLTSSRSVSASPVPIPIRTASVNSSRSSHSGAASPSPSQQQHFVAAGGGKGQGPLSREERKAVLIEQLSNLKDATGVTKRQ